MSSPPPLRLKVGDSAYVRARLHARNDADYLMPAQVIDVTDGRISVVMRWEIPTRKPPSNSKTYMEGRVSILEFEADGRPVNRDDGPLYLTTSARQRWFYDQENAAQRKGQEEWTRERNES